ncbi:MAG TPA: YcaO-related McrA-glycine thioamidation protein [Methanosarcinales archaeon]|nr:YcaO-related McrA-glycine thioamidation protein [Methanosarcinales archaeon]
MQLKINHAIKYQPDTQRVLDYETTLSNVENILPDIGVAELTDITDLDRVGIPVVAATRPSAGYGAIKIYSGKGATPIHARISAIMESVERCFAEIPEANTDFKGKPINTDIITDSYENLRRENAIDPETLFLPEPLPENTRLEWMQGWDLISESEVLVPSNAVYHPYARGISIFRSNTNGLASGNTIEEAIVHGLLEVIERDALSVTEYSRNTGREVLLHEDDGVVYDLKKRFEEAGISVKLWLLPSITEISVVVAVLDDVKTRDPTMLVMGAGAHLKPAHAVYRALTEAAQFRLSQISGARDDVQKRTGFVHEAGYERMKQVNRFWYVDGETIELAKIPDLSSNTPAKDIEAIIERLRGAALHAIVVDLSQPWIDVPVVRTIIPTFELYRVDRERLGSRAREARKEHKQGMMRVKRDTGGRRRLKLP